MKLFSSALIGTLLGVSSAFFAAVATAAPVNINRADATTIAAALNGIGDVKAQAIVAYREQHGPFKSMDELVNVKGIGLKTIDKNRSDILLSDGKPAAPKKAQ
jgi:competence protein ComEA